MDRTLPIFNLSMCYQAQRFALVRASNPWYVVVNCNGAEVVHLEPQAWVVLVWYDQPLEAWMYRCPEAEKPSLVENGTEVALPDGSKIIFCDSTN